MTTWTFFPASVCSEAKTPSINCDFGIPC
ncbi:unnamed protein product [Tetraodon nigroviridis]|uniref:(spotted green pufferfish) hypothetical protein n=1 Tax=Tetraodon nigroviridis TaxID=99883 RepID=Q4REL0_TETNG|nr:unnamed protein product [Tetraodon nigroviridis]